MGREDNPASPAPGLFGGHAFQGKTAGVMAMAGTAFLWSIAGLFIKAVDWNPFAIAGTRSFIASLVILLWLRRPRITLSFPQIAAAVANAATMILFVTANKTTTAANAILLQYGAPVFTALLGGLLLKERTRPDQWAALPFVAAGMIVMFMDRIRGGTLLGNSIAVLSGITFSFYFIFMRMQKKGSPLESILLSHWLAAGICLAVCLFLPAPAVTPKSIAAVAVLGILQIGVSAVLFSSAIRRISAVSASLIALIEPLCNPLWVFLVLGEAPGTFTIIGGGIIVAAVTAVSVTSARRKT